jgi:hypothetical protein
MSPCVAVYDPQNCWLGDIETLSQRPGAHLWIESAYFFNFFLGKFGKVLALSASFCSVNSLVRRIFNVGRPSHMLGSNASEVTLVARMSHDSMSVAGRVAFDVLADNTMDGQMFVSDSNLCVPTGGFAEGPNQAFVASVQQDDFIQIPNGIAMFGSFGHLWLRGTKTLAQLRPWEQEP